MKGSDTAKEEERIYDAWVEEFEEMQVRDMNVWPVDYSQFDSRK